MGDGESQEVRSCVAQFPIDDQEAIYFHMEQIVSRRDHQDVIGICSSEWRIKLPKLIEF
ncbi:hypothetical protein Plhal304r1_c075g0162631 [Plasmopara halstedii]